MVTLSSAQDALKSVYLGVVSDQLNINSNPLLAKIKQTSRDVWGKEIRKLAPFGINGGIGAGTEDGSLPSSAENKYVQFVSTLKNLYGTVEISDKAIRASSNNAGAFVNLLNDEMEGLVKASQFNLSRMLYGDGTGALATVVSYAGGVLTLSSVKNFVEGMVIDTYVGDNAVAALCGLRVAVVDRNAKAIKFTVTPSAYFEAGQTLYIQKSKDNEITGLGAIFKTSGTLYGVDKAIYPWMNPYIKTNAGEINDNMIQVAIDELEENTGSKVDFITCSATVKRAFAQYLTYFRRNIDVMELDGGYKALAYNGIPIVSDRFVEDDTMYLLNTDEFNLHQLCDWNWLEGEDGKIIKQVAGYPKYTATLVKYADLICNKPNGQAKNTGISSSVTNPLA